MKQEPKQTRASIRSKWPTSAHPLAILTDRRIEQYMLKGYYGRAAQEDAIARQKEKARKKQLSQMRRGSSDSVAVARLDLDGLY